MKWNPYNPSMNTKRPEPGSSVLVTCVDKCGNRKVIPVRCSDDAAAPFRVKHKVIAWTYLPEPYSGPVPARRGHLMQETKAAILETLHKEPEHRMPSAPLKRNVMRLTGCSERTYIVAVRDLDHAGQIVRAQTAEYPYWITELAPSDRT